MAPDIGVEVSPGKMRVLPQHREQVVRPVSVDDGVIEGAGTLTEPAKLCILPGRRLRRHL